MTAAAELEHVYGALRSYIAELRAREVRVAKSPEEAATVRSIANEIEARFLTDDAWRRITAEPVFAYGERGE